MPGPRPSSVATRLWSSTGSRTGTGTTSPSWWTVKSTSSPWRASDWFRTRRPLDLWHSSEARAAAGPGGAGGAPVCGVRAELAHGPGPAGRRGSATPDDRGEAPGADGAHEAAPPRTPLQGAARRDRGWSGVLGRGRRDAHVSCARAASAASAEATQGPGGRWRYTDCEWDLPGGTTLVLEVDGAFHMEVEHWEDDLRRHRGLTRPGRLIVRCTSREIRDEPFQVAGDLRALGLRALCA